MGSSLCNLCVSVVVLTKKNKPQRENTEVAQRRWVSNCAGAPKTDSDISIFNDRGYSSLPARMNEHFFQPLRVLFHVDVFDGVSALVVGIDSSVTERASILSVNLDGLFTHV